LSDAERATLEQIARKLKGSSQKVRRAHILLKADADGPAWTDRRIAESYGCRRQTVEQLRERLVTEGFESAVSGQARQPRPKVLDGTQEAQIVALRLGPPPAGFANW
jgi:transposase